MDILQVLQTIALVAFGGVALYFRTSEKAQKKVSEIQSVIADLTAQAVIFIKEAEDFYKDSTKAGGKKLEMVINKLYSLVPDALKLIVTKEMIKEIVQNTFIQIEEYAKMQLDKTVDNIKIETKKKTKAK